MSGDKAQEVHRHWKEIVTFLYQVAFKHIIIAITESLLGIYTRMGIIHGYSNVFI